MRRWLANTLYSLANRADGGGGRGHHAGRDTRFGETDGPSPHATFQVHMEATTPVSADYSNENGYTYAALHIGPQFGGARVTLFLKRRVVQRLMSVLGDVDREYREHGENNL